MCCDQIQRTKGWEPSISTFITWLGIPSIAETHFLSWEQGNNRTQSTKKGPHGRKPRTEWIIAIFMSVTQYQQEALLWACLTLWMGISVTPMKKNVFWFGLVFFYLKQLQINHFLIGIHLEQIVLHFILCILYVFICIYCSLCLFPMMCTKLVGLCLSEEDIWSPGIWVRNVSYNLGAGNWNQILSKSNKYSELLSHLFNPICYVFNISFLRTVLI